MKKLWMLTSSVFVFQLAIFFGSLLLPLAEPGKYGVACAFASIGTILVMSIALISIFVTPHRFSAMFAGVGVAAFTGTLAMALAILRPSGDFDSAIVAVVVFGVALIMAYLATFSEMNADHSKPRWALFITALPLGVGMVGGGILLFVFKFKKKNVIRIYADAKRSTVPDPGDDTPAEP